MTWRNVIENKVVIVLNTPYLLSDSHIAKNCSSELLRRVLIRHYFWLAQCMLQYQNSRQEMSDPAQRPNYADYHQRLGLILSSLL